VFVGHQEVYKAEVYARVRRAVQVDGISVRQAAREFGLSRKTIRTMLQFSLPSGHQRKKPVARPKLGPWLGTIDQILVDDKSQHKKQRHTAKRIWDRLKAEHGFGGGYTIVKDHVRQARLRHKEVFVPLAHPPGDAQADFGEALVVIAGVEQKAHLKCFRSAVFGRLLRDRLSGREHRGVSGRPQPGVRLFWRRATNHAVRQHPHRGEGDGGFQPLANSEVPGGRVLKVSPEARLRFKNDPPSPAISPFRR
jgi:transposase